LLCGRAKTSFIKNKAKKSILVSVKKNLFQEYSDHYKKGSLLSLRDEMSSSQQQGEGHPFESAFEPNRDDISSGMVVVRPPRNFIDNDENYGPLTCFPFYLENESSLPSGFQAFLLLCTSFFVLR